MRNNIYEWVIEQEVPPHLEVTTSIVIETVEEGSSRRVNAGGHNGGGARSCTGSSRCSSGKSNGSRRRRRDGSNSLYFRKGARGGRPSFFVSTYGAETEDEGCNPFNFTGARRRGSAPNKAGSSSWACGSLRTPGKTRCSMKTSISPSDAAPYNKKLHKKLARMEQPPYMRQDRTSAAPGLTSFLNRTAHLPRRDTAPEGNVSSYFISPVHQSVAEASAPWAGPGTPFQFLGHGGMSDPTSAVLPTSIDVRNEGGRGGIPAPIDFGRTCMDLAHNTWSGRAVVGVSSDEESPLAQARPIVEVGDCGGSKALGPRPSPSLVPPPTLLPSSKADMREDLLERFLMDATLEEDDFRLY